MSQRTGYTEDHAKAGLDHRFPEIDTWPNQFADYEIVIDIPEFTSVCPKTGLPDLACWRCVMSLTNFAWS